MKTSFFYITTDLKFFCVCNLHENSSTYHTIWFSVCIHCRNCSQSIELVYNNFLHFILTTHMLATQKLLQVCEQVEIIWCQVSTTGRIKKNIPGSVLLKWNAQMVFFLDNSIYWLKLCILKNSVNSKNVYLILFQNIPSENKNVSIIWVKKVYVDI
jgi:hypothetical protein